MASRIIPKTDLRDRIRAELADLGDDTIVVTDRGRPIAVVVDVERWNDLQHRQEDLEDQVAVLEHRLRLEGAAPTEQVFAAIEAEEANPGNAGPSSMALPQTQHPCVGQVLRRSHRQRCPPP